MSKELRSKTMQAVKSSDSGIEVALRKALWKKGYRYRKNYKRIFGRPDIVFVSLRIAVFCDSEFWHGYDWENSKYDIKSKRDYWWRKIERNIERDGEVTKALSDDGWTVLRFWGREIREDLDKCVEVIEREIHKRQN